MDNYSREERGGLCMQAPISARTVVTELTSDFTLPDYQPEIKRLLRVRATATPADRYVGVGTAELSGTVDFNVLYAGNDGALYSVTQAEEYRFEVPLELTSEFSQGEGIVCDAETAVESTAGRVGSPRKLSLRAKLRSDVRLYGERTVEERVDAADAQTLQRLCGNAACAEVFCATGEALALQDEISMDAQWQDLRVISAEAEVMVTEAVAGSGCVTCRGEVYLRLLCCREGEENVPAVQLRRLPFEQTVNVDGCEVNCRACAHGVCRDLRVTVEEGRILCDVSLCLQARCERNAEAVFTRDLYSTVSESEERYVELALPVFLKSLNGNVSVSHTATLEESGIRGGMTVLDASLIPSNFTVENAGNKYRLAGKCRCHLILTDGEDMSAQEIEIPYRYECDGEGERAEDCMGAVNALSCRARIEGDRIHVDGELAICATLRGEGRIRMLAEAKLGEAIRTRTAVYTVCYPAREDTLWSVAKRYRKPIDAIAEANALEGAASADARESLQGVAFLLV